MITKITLLIVEYSKYWNLSVVKDDGDGGIFTGTFNEVFACFVTFLYNSNIENQIKIHTTIRSKKYITKDIGIYKKVDFWFKDERIEYWKNQLGYYHLLKIKE